MPLKTECDYRLPDGTMTTLACAVLLWEDFEARERLLRGYCLAAGLTPAECQAETE